VTYRNMPEVHVDVRPLRATFEDAVELQRRELEDVDVRFRATLRRGEITIPGISLDKRQTVFIRCTGMAIGRLCVGFSRR